MLRCKMTSYALLLLSTIATAMSSETSTTIPLNHDPINDASTTGQRRTTVTLPLLTHHAMKQRRMLEMGLNEDEMESYLDSLPQRPSRPSSRRTSLEVGGLYQGYGTHYVDLWVGTPPQRQTVIIDTGSGVTAFPCSACSNCGKGYHASPLFVEANSSSFQKLKCDSCIERGTCTNRKKDNEYCKIGVSYQEGSSWSAYQAKDETYLGGPHNEALGTKSFEAGDEKYLSSGVVDENPEDAASFSFPLRFGCQTRITGLFKTQLADGIMGMCNQKGAFWHQMVDAGVIERQQFSLCFSTAPHSSSNGTSAGAVTMGGVDTNLHKSPMVFIDGHVASSSFWGITIRKVYFMKSGVTELTQDTTIKLDVSSSQLNTGKVILDSGTTDTYLTRKIADSFKKIFKSEVGVDYNTRGMKLTDAQFEKLPSLVVQLNGYSGSTDEIIDISDPDAHPRLAGKLDPDYPNDVLVVIPPNHYIEYVSKLGKYKPRLHVSDYSTTLGASFMAGHDILFNAKNNRIGFAVSDCSYPSLFNDELTANQNTMSLTSFPKISPTKSPTPITPITATNGNLIHPQGEENRDACNSFACGYRLFFLILGVFLTVLMVAGLIRRKYVNQNLEEFDRRKKRGENEIISLMEGEFEGEISKEMEMREIS